VVLKLCYEIEYQFDAKLPLKFIVHHQGKKTYLKGHTNYKLFKSTMDVNKKKKGQSKLQNF